MIHNPIELWHLIVGEWCHTEEEAKAKLTRAVYKYTDCGAYIGFEDDGIILGSIVEGSDEGTAQHELSYPFTLDAYNDALQAIEEEAAMLWREANEPDEEVA